MSAKPTHCFVPDPVPTSPLIKHNTSSPLPERSSVTRQVLYGAVNGIPQLRLSDSHSPSQPSFISHEKDMSQATLVANTTREVTDTTKSSNSDSLTTRTPAIFSNNDTDDTVSITSEESGGNASIPHGELYDDSNESTSVQQAYGENSETPTLPIAMPSAIEAQLNAWYAVHGRSTPPCATSTIPCFLYSRNVSGETAYFVHTSGECLKVCMYPLSDGQVPKHVQSRRRIIVAQGPTKGPFIIRYASQKNGKMEGTSYKIWHGVRGGDKDGFELVPSVHKRYESTGKEPPKPAHKAKRVPSKKGGFKVNQLYAAQGTPKPGTKARRRPTVAAGNSNSAKSSYDFRPSKRPKQDEERPANYRKLLTAFSNTVEHTSNPKQGEQSSHNGLQEESGHVKSNQVIEHIQNNAVFLFYPKGSLQPRARVFGACNTIQKLFAQALAGDVFDEDTTVARVLSIRVAGQRKAKAVVEDDEQDYDDVIDALKEAPCWAINNWGISGSCTVEVRAKS